MLTAFFSPSKQGHLITRLQQNAEALTLLGVPNLICPNFKWSTFFLSPTPFQYHIWIGYNELHIYFYFYFSPLCYGSGNINVRSQPYSSSHFTWGCTVLHTKLTLTHFFSFTFSGKFFHFIFTVPKQWCYKILETLTYWISRAIYPVAVHSC
jgi:hypothetical protein